MRREERGILKVVLGVAAVGALAPILFFTGLFVLGTAVAPPLPAPPDTSAPRLVKDALWARAGGGRAAELRPINPLTMAQFAACVAQAPGANDNERMAACRHVMPAMPAMEYLSNVLLRDHGVNRNSFRGGAGAMVTMLRVSRSWTKEDFLNTLAARADFGFGFRGADAAAHGYFGTSADRLELHQAALIAAFPGENYIDPWCWPVRTAELRNRILARMLENGAIDESAYQQAVATPLGIVPRSGDRPPCEK